jgi:hypothetical protein
MPPLMPLPRRHYCHYFQLQTPLFDASRAAASHAFADELSGFTPLMLPPGFADDARYDYAAIFAADITPFSLLS